MTKIITAVIVLVVAWVIWIGYQKWENVSSTQDKSQAQVDAEARAAVAGMNPRSLPGIPEKMKDKLENSLEKSQTTALGLHNWLQTYKPFVEDPRLAWIQLDYVVLVAQDNPAEAKRVFKDVRDRTSPTSLVYPRIKQLEKTYE